MFNFIRRHQILALVFIAIVIVSFVVFFSPDVSLGNSRGGVALGSIDGRPVSSREHLEAQREILTFLKLRYGADSDRAIRDMGIDLNQEAYSRVLLRRKIREYGIEVTDDAVRLWIQENLTEPQTGAVNVPVLKQALDPMRLDDLERMARTEVGRHRLMALVGMSGTMVTPQEAAVIYRRVNRPNRVEIVFFNPSEYTGKVEVTDEAIEEFFRQRGQSAYRTPEKRRVSLVKFDTESRLGEAERIVAERMPDLDERLKTSYAQNPEAFRKGEEEVPLEEEALERARKELINHQALILARQAANGFVEKIMAMHQDRAPDSRIVEQVAAGESLEVDLTPPFERGVSPEEMAIPDQVRQGGFQLSVSQPYTTMPVVTTNAVYVLGLREVVPSRPQALEDVRERVVEDYKRSEAARLAREAGEAFQAAAVNSLVKERPFAEIAGEHQLEVIPVTFSQSTRMIPELQEKAVHIGMLQQAVSQIEAGRVTGFIPTWDGGMVLFLHGSEEVDEEKMREELPDFMANLRHQRQVMAFSDWLREQQQQIRIPAPPAEQQEAAAR